MLKCNDVHANENVKAVGYAVCKNQKYLRHVMLHDGLMPMHNAKQKKIEPLHRFFFYSSLYITICQRILHPECRHCPSSGDTELRNLVVSRGSRTPQAARKWIPSNCG